MSASTAISPPIDQLLRLAEVAAEMHSLLLLDSAWTGAEKLSVANGGDTSGVAAIGERVEASLVQLAESTAFLRDLMSNYKPWFDAQIDAALLSNKLSDGQQATVSALLKGGSDSYADNGIAVMDELATRIPAERNGLNAKITQIKNGGGVVTDLDAATVCGVATGFGMASLTACVVFDAPGVLPVGRRRPGDGDGSLPTSLMRGPGCRSACRPVRAACRDWRPGPTKPCLPDAEHARDAHPGVLSFSAEFQSSRIGLIHDRPTYLRRLHCCGTLI